MSLGLTPRLPHRGGIAITLGIIFLSAGVRLAACFDAFWLDEVWSWGVAVTASSPAELVTRPESRTDNNHLLNTLWIYSVGDTPRWWLYRLPSLLTGAALVALVALAELQRTGHTAAILAAIAVGVSFPLVTYSSEARGYAPMLLCAASAYYTLQSYLSAPRPHRALLFGLLCALGLLSHLTFLHFLAASVVLVVWGRAAPQGNLARTLAVLYALPAVTLASLWFTFYRHVRIGGGGAEGPIEAIRSALALILGGTPAPPFIAAIVAVLTLVLLRYAIAWYWRTDRRTAPFFPAVIFIVPALTTAAQAVLLRDNLSIMPRYLLVPVLFALILLARFAADALRSPGRRRTVAILLTTLFITANACQITRFLHTGRGDYRRTVELMARTTPGSQITIAGNHPFRIPTLLSYYERLAPGKQFGFTDRPDAPADWFILDVAPDDPSPVSPTLTTTGRRYRLVATYPAYGLSGSTWLLFRAE